MNERIIDKVITMTRKFWNNFRNDITLYLFAFVSLFFVPSDLFSQQDSLYSYMEIAASHNPVVLQKYYEYQAALQKIPQVGTLADPELSMGVFLSPMELVGGNQLADLRLMQMFPWFGVLKSARDEMSLMANARFEQLRDTKLQVCYDVQRMWFELYKTRRKIAISKDNIEILKTIERLATTRYSAPSGSKVSAPSPGKSDVSAGSTGDNASGMQSMGVTKRDSGSEPPGGKSSSMAQGSMNESQSSPTLADLFRIQIERGDVENNMELLNDQQKVNLAKFNSLLNRPPASKVFIPETLNADSLGIPITEVSDSMMANNPMLGMIVFEEQAIDAKKKMVTRMGYPMIGIGLNYTLIAKSEMSSSSMNGRDMIMPMVTLTLPVYRKKYAAMQKESDFLKNASLQKYQETANALETEYSQAIQLYMDSKRRVKLYEAQSVLAQKSLDLVLAGFSVSESGLTDVLRVRQQTLDYEIKKIEAITDLCSAVAWLKRLGNL